MERRLRRLGGHALIDLDAHLQSIALGDADAFALWLAHAEPTLRAGLRSFASQVDTEAVLQEALLRVWQVASRVTPDGRPNSLLRLGQRIARNLALDELRRRRHPAAATAELARAAERVPLAPKPPDPLLRMVLEQCWEKLSGAPRKAMEARLELLAHPDRVLAHSCQMTLNTFLQNVRRARLNLLACLERSGVPANEVGQ